MSAEQKRIHNAYNKRITSVYNAVPFGEDLSDAWYYCHAIAEDMMLKFLKKKGITPPEGEEPSEWLDEVADGHPLWESLHHLRCVIADLAEGTEGGDAEQGAGEDPVNPEPLIEVVGCVGCV